MLRSTMRFLPKRVFGALLVAPVAASLLVSGCGEAPKLPTSSETASKPSAPDDPVTGEELRRAVEKKTAAAEEAVEQETESRGIAERDAAELGRVDEDQRTRGAPLDSGAAEIAGAPPVPVSASPPEGEVYSGPLGGAPAETAAAEVAPPPPPPAAAPSPGSSAPSDRASRGLEPAEPDGRAGAAPSAAAPAPGLGGTAAQEPFDVVPVFFGTDRAVAADPKRLQYGSERGHKLQLGRALVTVPSSHKVPHIERPWVIEIPYFKYKIYEEKEDPNKHFTLQEISALTKDQLLGLVKERLAASQTFKDHAFIFVHGFNTSFDAALYRTAQIAYDLKFDGAPFVYSWPSGGKVASYTYDRGSAEQAEPHLAEFINMVVKESGAKSISLIAHSMGNEVLLRVLERMRPSVPEDIVISQVILAAPDVDRDKFGNIAREIVNFAKGVTLYAASNDRALGYSARFWGGVPRAGDVPATGPLIVPGVDTIDVTSVSTDSLGLNHSGYAENPALLDDIKALIQAGVRPPDKRIDKILKVDSDSGVFWRFKPGM